MLPLLGWRAAMGRKHSNDHKEKKGHFWVKRIWVRQTNIEFILLIVKVLGPSGLFWTMVIQERGQRELGKKCSKWPQGRTQTRVSCIKEPQPLYMERLLNQSSYTAPQKFICLSLTLSFCSGKLLQLFHRVHWVGVSEYTLTHLLELMSSQLLADFFQACSQLLLKF